MTSIEYRESSIEFLILSYKSNSQLFHKTNLRCVKPVKNKFFLCAKSILTATSIKWKRNFPKRD